VQSRDSCRLDFATEQKYAAYRTLPVLNSRTVFADYFKCHFSISFSEEMVGLFDFIFVRRSFLGVDDLKIGYYNYWFSPLLLL